MPISRGQTPRQLYGLGSFVKSIGKAVKGAVKSVGKVAKSPLGLAALTYGLGGGTFFGKALPGLAARGSGFGIGNIVPNVMNYLVGTGGGPAGAITKGLLGSGGKFSTFGKVAAIAAPSIIGGMLTKEAQEDVEALRQSGDRGLLQGYLRRYYGNLNPNASSEEIEEFVRTNSAEGGRIGFQEGGGIEQRLEQLGGDVTSAEQMLQGINQRLKTAESSLGSGGGGLGTLATLAGSNQPFNPGMKYRPQPNISVASAIFPSGPLANIPLPGSPGVPDLNKFNEIKDIFMGNMSPSEPGSLIPLEENPNFQNIPEQFRSGFANYLKENPNSFGFGGQAMTSVGLPGGGSVTFGDTGSAGAFRKYLESTGFTPPGPIAVPTLAPSGVETIQASGTFNGKPLFPEGTIFPSGGVSLAELYPNAGQTKLDPPTFMRPGNIPGTDVPYSTLRGGMGSPLQQAMGFADGGRIGYARGDTAEQNAMQASGIMGLPLNENPAGVTELDLRESGGFIPPVGVKEKADDIPAMLSNNEFVFTADAVRGMGDGNVNLGAQRMYDMMKKLENGGRV